MPIISGRDNENSRWTLFSLSLTLTIGIFHCFNYTLLLLHLITTHLVRLVLFSLCLFWFFLLLLFAFLFHLLFPISLTLIISIFYCLNYTLLLVHLITTHLVPLALFCLWLFCCCCCCCWFLRFFFIYYFHCLWRKLSASFTVLTTLCYYLISSQHTLSPLPFSVFVCLLLFFCCCCFLRFSFIYNFQFALIVDKMTVIFLFVYLFTFFKRD